MFLATCFVIGPEQVHALHVEALSAHLAAGSAIGLTENVTVDYAYDDNGNMIQRVSSAAGTTNYTYDSENRLIKVADPNGSLASITTYAYDTDGIRTAKITGTGTTTYLTDKNQSYAQVLEERNGDSRVLNVRYTYGHDLISQHRPDGQGSFNTHYYHYDGQLSTRQLSDADGDPTDNYTYDAFGELLASSGDTINSYLYAGEQFDANSGFYYLRARYYNALIGRLVNRDTYLGKHHDPRTLHGYLYTPNNPLSFGDPSGHSFNWIGVGIAALVSGVIGSILAGAYEAAKGHSIAKIASAAGWGFVVGFGFGLFGGALGAGLAAASVAAGGSAAAGYAAAGLILGPTALGQALENLTYARKHGDNVDRTFAWIGVGLAGFGVVLSHFGAFSVGNRGGPISRLANSRQTGDYKPDPLVDSTVAKGTILYQLSNEERPPAPGNWFTTADTLIGSDLDAGTIASRVQVRDPRPFVNVYQAIDNVEGAVGTTGNNTRWGAGGYPQVFIPNPNGGSVRFIGTLNLKTRAYPKTFCPDVRMIIHDAETHGRAIGLVVGTDSEACEESVGRSAAG